MQINALLVNHKSSVILILGLDNLEWKSAVIVGANNLISVHCTARSGNQKRRETNSAETKDRRLERKRGSSTRRLVGQ